MEDRKRGLRRSMRDIRRGLDDRGERSERIAARLFELDDVRNARRVMAYRAVVGEVETDRLIEWFEARGVEVRMPEDDVEPTWPDLIIVPGLAFTPRCDRLGQGGGWYDRMLSAVAAGTVTIGIGFDVQLVDEVPLEAHDVRLHMVVTETTTHRRQAT